MKKQRSNLATQQDVSTCQRVSKNRTTLSQVTVSGELGRVMSVQSLGFDLLVCTAAAQCRTQGVVVTFLPPCAQ